MLATFPAENSLEEEIEEEPIGMIEPSDLADAGEINLVRWSQRGDRDAFGELARRYQTAVYAIGQRYLNNHAEAQELVQEVLLRAMNKIGQLRHPECFAGWLRSATRRMALNRLTRRGPRLDIEPHALANERERGESPLESALAREERQQVRAGLARLRRLDRETLSAFYVDGQSLIEMSVRFDSPVGTIKRRLHVARKRLAEELAELAPA
jgi:RNA polymerase sigma-70 factor (ECF subfamily)